LGQAVVYGLLTLPDEVRSALRISRRRLARLDQSLLEPPDSSVARKAEELIAGLAPPMVVNHVYRTYAFGAVLAAHDGIGYDREVVYVASLLHDLYFASPRALDHPHCFTLPAAEKAIELGGDAGWDEQRRELVADAITLHLNVSPPRRTAEAYVVYAGARLDVTGYRYRDLHPDTVEALIERHPRLDLKRESAPIFDELAVANPGSRAHFVTRYLAVKWFIRRAPFAE
jgi:hypothetical protein